MWVSLQKAAVSTGCTGQWLFLDGPFLFSSSPISQIEMPRQRQRTNLGATEAQACRAPPCST